jgi:flagellar FliL protein
MAKKVEVDAKFLIAVIAFLIVAVVGSSFVTYLMFRGSSTETGAGSWAEKEVTEMGPTFDAGEFLLNLTSINRTQPRFIRTEIVLEASDKKVVADLETRTPQVRDTIISLIRARTYEQLSEPAGMELLRLEIMKNMNTLLSKGEVTNVYFVDLIIQ